MSMLTAEDISALRITVALALISTALLLILATPLAWWLSRTQAKIKPAIDALIALPLVLPPTVLGFYLLIALGPDGAIGKLTTALGIEPLAFTFTGLVIGSVIYSLPFVVQPLQDSFREIGSRPLEAAATLRAKRTDIWFSIVLPLARPGYLTAAVLGFAHTLGEFGVVLMIGGNIPGSTRVLSIAIYDHVETLDYAAAHSLSALLLLLSFTLLLIVYVLNRRVRLVRV